VIGRTKILSPCPFRAANLCHILIICLLLDLFKPASTEDDLDRLVKTTDPLGGVTAQRYDSEGRMTESEDARLVKIRMGYDATGGMEKLTDGNDHETPPNTGFAESSLV